MGGKKANEENKKRTTTTQMATMTLTMSMNGQKKRIKNPAHMRKTNSRKKRNPGGGMGGFPARHVPESLKTQCNRQLS